MDSAEQRGLACLPAVVYTEGLLPLLSVNEVLRLRRVCKPLKSICDEHLRKKCPSKSVVRLREREEYPNDIYIDLLSKFLEFDTISSIRIPSQNFSLYLDQTLGFGPLSLNLSTRYGAQIKHLCLDSTLMELPFVSNSSQFNFFQNLTNLSSLKLDGVVIRADREVVPESLPTCFKNKIRKFEMRRFLAEGVSDADKFWETVRLFEKLEYFRFPDYDIIDIETSHRPALENCCKFIEAESSNIKCLDLQNLDIYLDRCVESWKSFSELSLRNNIKWENVPAWIIREPLYTTALMPNMHLVVSITEFCSEDASAECLSFPNLVSLDCYNITLGMPYEEGLRPDLSKIPQILSPSIYPALRIFKVAGIRGNTEDNTYFSRAWKYLTNLEEVSISSCVYLSSEAFLGDEDETQEPPFLRLKKLKKLSLRFHFHEGDAAGIQNAFPKAFQRMPLKEFVITSECAISSVFFDKDAILALSLPGPFIENIEKFSFRNWSMEGVTDDEFQQLGRKFPNNQAL